MFQLGLILGKPWGEWTMGGYNKGVLPIKLRFGAFVSVLILLFFILFIIDFTQTFNFQLGFPKFIKWLIIGFNLLSVVANSATQSQKEKRLWQPITIVMLGCSLWLFLIQ